MTPSAMIDSADAASAVTVHTVRGEISSAELGMTLTHEHLICDWNARAAEPTAGGATDAETETRGSLVDASWQWLLTENPALLTDNGRLDDADTVIDELRNFTAAGGRTVVECTTGDVGRDALALREISERSGVNIVMGSGWYVHAFHREADAPKTSDELCDELVAEFTDGVDGTGVRPGIIGEIGVSPQFTEAEHRRLRAACRAQRQVGVPLLIHMPGWQRRAAEVLDLVLGEEGVRPESVVLCHMDPAGTDEAYLRATADRGVWLEFDMIGMLTFYAGEGQSPSPEQTATAIANLIAAGYADRILLSHDVSVKGMWTRNGGNGLGYVPRLFLPRLQRQGVPPQTAAALLTRNPEQLFSLAAGARSAA